MVATPEVWQQLSRSSKLALRWAGAAARARNERNGRSPDNAEVDEFDLLVGILLAHLRDSEPRALLAHVGATAADLLPLEYSLPTEALLERHVRAVSGTTSPGLSDEVEGVLLDATASFMSSDGFVELRGLFGALLQGTNRVATAIFDLLDRTGLPGAASTYSDYVRDPPPGGYAEFLASRHPFTATPVEIPTYKADHGPGALGDDYVDIRAEVDAFAYLLASRALHPPLAVGLFGEWGSGKTYFMDAVRSRIEQLTPSPLVATAPQAEVLFWKRVAQIEFNAWHYVEGDL